MPFLYNIICDDIIILRNLIKEEAMEIADKHNKAQRKPKSFYIMLLELRRIYMKLKIKRQGSFLVGRLSLWERIKRIWKK